jgi:transposase
MERYVGLDISLKLTAICIVDRTGKIERGGVVSSDPEAIATFIKSHAPNVARIGLETGATTTTWLWTELNKLGLPVICIDARHAKAALKMQINKSDRNRRGGNRIPTITWCVEHTTGQRSPLVRYSCPEAPKQPTKKVAHQRASY